MTNPEGLLKLNSVELTQLLRVPSVELTSQMPMVFNPLGTKAFNGLFKMVRLPKPEKLPSVLAQLVKLDGAVT